MQNIKMLRVQYAAFTYKIAVTHDDLCVAAFFVLKEAAVFVVKPQTAGTWAAAEKKD